MNNAACMFLRKTGGSIAVRPLQARIDPSPSRGLRESEFISSPVLLLHTIRTNDIFSENSTLVRARVTVLEAEVVERQPCSPDP